MKRTVYLGLIGVILAAVLVVAFLTFEPSPEPSAMNTEFGNSLHSLSLQDAELASARGHIRYASTAVIP